VVKIAYRKVVLSMDEKLKEVLVCVLEGSRRASESFIQSFTSSSPRHLVGCVPYGCLIRTLLFIPFESLVVMSTEERRLVAEDGT